MVLIKFMAVMLLISAPLHAQTIRKIKEAEKIVVIDFGSSGGVKVGTKVCFADNICGVVLRTLRDFSYVGVTSLGELKVGYKAKIVIEQTAADTQTADTQPATPAPITPPPPPPPSQLQGTPLFGYYIFSPVTVANYEKLSFLSGNGETLWDSSGRVLTSVLGVGTGIGYSLYGFPGISGIRAKFQGKSSAFTQISDTELGVTSVLAFSGGVWSEVYPLVFNLANLAKFNLGGGFDFDVSRVTVGVTSVNQEEGASTPLIAANSTLEVISLKGVASLIVPLPEIPMGVVFSLNLFTPLVSFNQFTAAFGIEQNLNSKSFEQDFVDSLFHRKSGVGFEVVAGVFTSL
jgi:hypothetical protein